MLKKSDLRTGMKVITENNHEWIVMLNAYHRYDDTKNFLLNLRTDGWLDLDSYDDNLKIMSDEREGEIDSFDVKEVYEPDHLMSLFANKYKNVQWVKPRQRMTKKEIEKELGYEIEIVE